MSATLLDAPPQAVSRKTEAVRVRKPELDGLRGLAILSVLVWHFVVETAQTEPGSWAAYALVPGRLLFSGVDLFFVLSGYLIGGILLEARDSPRYFRTFYARRAYRILPLYFAVLTACYLTSDIGAPWLYDGLRPAASYLTFTQNFFMRDTLGGNFLAVNWSLAIEEQFYLLAPLVVRFLNRAQLKRCLVACILLAPFVRAVLHSGVSPLSAFALVRFDALAPGALAAMYPRLPDAKYLHHALAALSAGVALLLLANQGFDSLLMVSAGYTWLALFYLCLLLVSLRSGLFRWAWLGRLGVLAYGVYLFHQAVQGLVFHFIRGREPKIEGVEDLALVGVACAITLLLASLSWKYFEGPLVRRGHAHRY